MLGRFEEVTQETLVAQMAQLPAQLPPAQLPGLILTDRRLNTTAASLERLKAERAVLPVDFDTSRTQRHRGNGLTGGGGHRGVLGSGTWERIGLG